MNEELEDAVNEVFEPTEFMSAIDEMTNLSIAGVCPEHIPTLALIRIAQALEVIGGVLIENLEGGSHELRST